MMDALSVTCRALSHPVRRALLRAISSSECDVGGLSAMCGIDQPTASKHLAALRSAGLVAVRVDGPRRCYSLLYPEVQQPLLELLDRLQERQDAEQG